MISVLFPILGMQFISNSDFIPGVSRSQIIVKKQKYYLAPYRLLSLLNVLRCVNCVFQTNSASHFLMYRQPPQRVSLKTSTIGPMRNLHKKNKKQ